MGALFLELIELNERGGVEERRRWLPGPRWVVVRDAMEKGGLGRGGVVLAVVRKWNDGPEGRDGWIEGDAIGLL